MQLHFDRKNPIYQNRKLQFLYFAKHVVLINTTCLPNMWNWTIPHVWRNFSGFTGKNSMVRLNICTHYWNVNPMTLKMLHWKIHTSSLEFKQSNTRPPASCWIVSTLVSRYGFFNVTFLKWLDWHSSNVYKYELKLVWEKSLQNVVFKKTS